MLAKPWDSGHVVFSTCSHAASGLDSMPQDRYELFSQHFGSVKPYLQKDIHLVAEVKFFLFHRSS